MKIRLSRDENWDLRLIRLYPDESYTWSARLLPWWTAWEVIIDREIREYVKWERKVNALDWENEIYPPGFDELMDLQPPWPKRWM